jgi:hypothetical protein
LSPKKLTFRRPSTGGHAAIIPFFNPMLKIDRLVIDNVMLVMVEWLLFKVDLPFTKN